MNNSVQFTELELKQIYEDKSNLLEALKTNEKLLIDLEYKSNKIKNLEVQIDSLERKVHKLSMLLNDSKK